MAAEKVLKELASAQSLPNKLMLPICINLAVAKEFPLADTNEMQHCNKLIMHESESYAVKETEWQRFIQVCNYLERLVMCPRFL